MLTRETSGFLNRYSFVLVLISEPKQVAKVEGFLERLNHKLRLNETQFNKLLVATTEAVNNGIIHGNKRDPKKNVTITCIIEGSAIIVRIHDEGPGFDVSHLPDPLAEENLLLEHRRALSPFHPTFGLVGCHPVREPENLACLFTFQ
jgi:serine/threonine-protein kinase RsbW